MNCMSTFRINKAMFDVWRTNFSKVYPSEVWISDYTIFNDYDRLTDKTEEEVLEREWEFFVWLNNLCDTKPNFSFASRLIIDEAVIPKFKVDFDWKRERDYPTLKQGLRDPKFRNRRK